ncbi:MAG: adenylosuccinate lyase [Gemmatimonadota bacterium]
MDRTLLERLEAGGPETEYHNPLTERYASKTMRRLFSPAFKFGTWRRLWLALAEAEKESGLEIPDEAIAQMREHLDDVDLEAAAVHERRLRHDVMAHVHHFGDVAPAARPFIHLGATSCFVTDNTELIQQREALRLVRRRLLSAIGALAAFTREHRDLPTLGFTHFQPAQPTTVGKRASLWLQDLVLDLEEVDHRIATLRARSIRGATGTQASFLELFDGDHDKVEALQRRVADAMGFDAVYGVTGQTYPRKVDYANLAALGGIAASTSKFAHDIRLLAHLREVEEPFGENQIGSSAMPYKRNPMRTERITALARHVLALTTNAGFTAATQWFERTLDDSANRRIAVAEAFLTTDAILLLVHNVAAGLVVRPAVIRRRLEHEMPFLATESILMHAVRRGGDRQDLHERIRQHSVAAADRLKEGAADNDLPDRIAGDPAFGMTRDEVLEVLDPARHVGRAPRQVDAYLAELAPLLERAELDEAPELRA